MDETDKRLCESKCPHCIILVYDITQRDTFQNVNKWMKQIKDFANQNVRILLVGNKCDLAEKRTITFEDAQELAKNLGIHCFETSAKDSTNVDQAFYHIAEDAIQHSVHKLPGKDKPLQLSGEDVKKKGCC